MTPKPARPRRRLCLRAFWRCERGIGVLEVLAIAAALAAAFAGAQALAKKIPALQAQIGPIRQCQATVKAAIDDGIKSYRVFDENGNLVFPPGLQIPLDDPAVIAIKSCQTEMAKFNDAVKRGNYKALDELGNQIDGALRFVGTCTITNVSDFNTPGTAGVPYSNVVMAHIPFEGGSQATGTVVAAGAAAGGGAITSSSQGKDWIGNVAVSGDASIDAAGGTSQVTVRATTPALVTKNPDGSCPSGISQPLGASCVLRTGADGTCPGGLIPNAGRCDVSCTTPPVNITWQAPSPAKVVSFLVSPKEIDKGSTQPVTLYWVVNNTQTVSINQGVGDSPADPTKTTKSPGVVVNPPPPTSTTWTLLALGVGGRSSDSRTATLVVKEPTQQFAVAISSPRANEQILDAGVTVSGTIQPVPDADQRKAQILVNGSFLSEATIDGAGNFSARTALLNTIALSDIDVVGDPAVSVTSCGAVGAPIGVAANPFPNAKNLIRVVVPLASGSVSASVQVEHVISVISFQVNWGGGCGSAPSQNQSLGIVVRGNQPPVSVGFVNCGFNGPAHCSDVATITIGTSVGSKVVSESWSANIDSCN